MNHGTPNLRHEFVEFIPEALEPGMLYISVLYATASHLCCCGCGQRVVTPLTPTDWTLVFDGETVSLDPSIGNWSFPCRSHYWIIRNHVKWAAQWSEKEIAAGREWDTVRKSQRIHDIPVAALPQPQPTPEFKASKPSAGLLHRVKNWFSLKS